MESSDIRAHALRSGRGRLGAAVLAGTVVAALPLVGLVSLLLRSQLDPHVENYPLHFVVFGVVGAVDAAIDARLAVWDYAAVIPIVEQAGGRITALDGGRPRPNEQVVTSNGAVHNELLTLLQR